MQNALRSRFQSVTDFKTFLSEKGADAAVFLRLEEDDLAFFVGQLKFSDTGFPGGYWGDIAKNEKMTDAQLSEFVASAFGVDKGEFEKCLHYFGTMEGTCTSRPYYNCPYC